MRMEQAFTAQDRGLLTMRGGFRTRPRPRPYSAVKLRRVGRGAGSTDRDPFCSGGCMLLLTYASPVTPYKPTAIAGVSHTSLTERGMMRAGRSIYTMPGSTCVTDLGQMIRNSSG
jgi:hypothetical protein